MSVCLSVAGKILTFLPSHPPLINSFPTHRGNIIFLGGGGKKKEKIDEIFPNC